MRTKKIITGNPGFLLLWYREPEVNAESLQLLQWKKNKPDYWYMRLTR
jgi:hypothetical protein